MKVSQIFDKSVSLARIIEEEYWKEVKYTMNESVQLESMRNLIKVIWVVSERFSSLSLIEITEIKEAQHCNITILNNYVYSKDLSFEYIFSYFNFY